MLGLTGSWQAEYGYELRLNFLDQSAQEYTTCGQILAFHLLQLL